MKISLFIVCLFTVFAAAAQIEVKELRCEMLNNPVGIDVMSPRLSWQIVSNERNVFQTAYEIMVASSKEKLNKGEGDLWKSGKISSSQSVLVSYNGKALSSRMNCYWKIRSYTNKGTTAWSEAASWSMGLLDQNDWKAKWIGMDKAFPWDSVTQFSRLSARYLRKEFQTTTTIKKATAYIVGLGMYELYINGKKTGDQVLAPAATDYRKSVFYNTFDVTTLLNKGSNVIATVLGNGRFFTMRQDYKPKKINTFGYPKLLFQLEIEYADGKKKTIMSDESWKLTTDGPIRTNNEYDGEEYDATRELTGWDKPGYNDSKWMKPELVKAPGGKITAQMNTPMKIMQVIKPVSVKELKAGTYIMDMGQNFAGWVSMQVKGAKGTVVQLRFAESLQKDGSLYVANLRDAKVTDKYTLKGEGLETWQPAFVYHGFRYVEISNYPGVPTVNDFEGKLVYDDMETTGTFESSNTTLNKIHRNAWWGIASNYKGMPVDCPQRNERQPWLGDRATGSSGEAFLFGNAALYAKWLDDIEQSQTPEGSIPDVAPAFWNYYSDNVTWPGTYILVADMLYRQYGDNAPIKKHYASMKKWMEYMQSKYMKDHLITKDKYGDWCVPPESPELIRSRDSLRNTDGTLIATAYYYQLLKIMSRFAVIAKQEQDIKKNNELLTNIYKAFNNKFLDSLDGHYDNNTITANLLPFSFGMVPYNHTSKVFDNICRRIKADSMHISTGVIGTQWLMRTLTQDGKGDIAYHLASNTSYPSWGYMAEQGATTIWELWNGNTANPQMNSQNHVMLLGDLLVWMYEDLAGIKTFSGYHELFMQPAFNCGLDSVNASYASVYGKIVSNWKIQGNELVWNIEIPANCTAHIRIPSTGVITESGKPVENSASVFSDPEHSSHLENVSSYKIYSGKYQFRSTIK